MNIGPQRASRLKCRSIEPPAARPVLVLAIAWCLLGAAALAAARPQRGELWLVSTRGTGDGSEPQFFVRDGNRWASSDRAAFLATDDPGTPTTFFVHGNRADSEDAVAMGMEVFHRLRREAGDRPLRMVIWSWPSQRVSGGNRYDVQVKARRTQRESYELARFVDRIDPRVPVRMVGYSFGARIIAGSLELLAGRPYAGRRLALSHPERRPLRAVMVAAAVDEGWSPPRAATGGPLVERLLVTRNERDRVLRLYPLLYRRGGPEALGTVGRPQGRLVAGRVETWNVASSVGRAHDWQSYSSAPGFADVLARYIFGPDELGPSR